MLRLTSHRTLAIMLLAGLQCAPASAQPARDLGSATLSVQAPEAANLAAVPRDAIRVPCCRCLDGTRQTVNINTGTARWQVTSPGSTGIQPVALAGNPAWTPVPPARWVGPPGNPTTVGDYTYFIRIYVPRCTIPPRVVMSGRFAADNSARVFLDANQIAASQGTPNYGFLPGSITPFSASLSPGLHTVRVIVRNISGPTGMILQGSLTITCPRELEQPDRQFEVAPDRPDMSTAEPGA